MSLAGGCSSWQAMVSVRTSIVPPWPCPPFPDTPGTSPAVTAPQVTASVHDFAGSLVRKSAHRDLLDWEKKYNTAVNRIRYVVERPSRTSRPGGSCTPTTGDPCAP